MKRVVYHTFFLLLLAAPLHARRDTVTVVHADEQKTFQRQIPAGNYSGITHLEGNEYAVVNDKSATDGFHVFAIDIDSITGEILNVQDRGFRSAEAANRDGEGIAYLPSTKTILISGEADGKILEYGLDGHRTIREAAVPEIFSKMRSNLGFEALTYSAATRLVWTCNESTLQGDGEASSPTNGVANVVRLQCFDEALRPLRQYAYRMDAPMASASAELYAMGVPELVALEDGSLLVLEREFYVPSSKLGAFVNCRLYQAWPSVEIDKEKPIGEETVFADKNLVYEWKTSLGLFSHEIANYEGMCLGPLLRDGSRALILVSDSQNQYGGVLKDWFKTIVLR